ncbi:unnamed protein product [Coffea canephora]|uniref:DH200=94 genomic scaffold, scaffold_2768 n=1 Tax=Coffea canephora TaxID=49390 RepID=A0A068VKI9_COFCA|nr:unnamed protein product [Coffea canephora]
MKWRPTPTPSLCLTSRKPQSSQTSSKTFIARHLQELSPTYAVFRSTGHQTFIESWGTGSTISRISCVPGGGTHRAGQGAYGNMCRGRMFALTKIWRRWHHKVPVNKNRYAFNF